jgi:hypothetical protein
MREIVSPLSGIRSPFFGRRAFSPLSLLPFVWYDPSDLSTMFQDSAGTTPVTAAPDPVGRINDKSGNGKHATQATSGARPLLQLDAGGRQYLAVDGVDDILSSATQTQIVGPWEFWAGVDITTNGGIQTNLFSLSPATGVSSSGETEGLFQRSDGALRRVIGASRVAAETIYNANLDAAFTVGSRFVARVRAETGPDQVSVTTPAGTATIAAAYTGTPSSGNARYNIGAPAGAAVWRFYGGLVFDRALTAGEAAQLDGWFRARMGI